MYIDNAYMHNDRIVEYKIDRDENKYIIDIDGNHIECTSETTPFKYIDIETACRMHIDMIFNELYDKERIKNEELNKPISQEEIQAEILLNQAEILTNQNSQDEVLAEILLNSLEVSTNV